MPSLRTTTADIQAATRADQPDQLTRIGGSCFIGAFNRGIADELDQKIKRGVRLAGTPSAQQEQVFNWGKTSTGSLLVVARAGCGKTTTALELAQMVSPNITASTLHSLGLRVWNSIRCSERNEFSSARPPVEPSKVRDLTYKVWPFDRAHPENKDIARTLIQLISFAKGQGFGVNLPGCPAIEDRDAWAQVIDFYELLDEIPETLIDKSGIGVVSALERLIDDAIDIYKRSLNLCRSHNKIDYDDMILAPLYFGPIYSASPGLYDWVMLDEAQDTSWTRFLLCRYVLKPGGRMVCIGDPAQAINLFAGATCDALDVIQKELSAHSLPLSITYRCPRSIVALAQQWVPEFTAHASAPEGKITTIPHTQFWNQKFNPVQDVILCRLNRPLAGIASRLRAMGINCIVEGQSAKGLIRLATKWGSIGIPNMLNLLNEWFVAEAAKWEARGRLDKVERLQDRVGTVMEVALEVGGKGTTDDVVAALEKNFGEGQYAVGALHLCSIHKAKGREWKRVFLIGRERYMPSPWAKRPEELQQEKNLSYVATTRTKEELVEVVVPPKKKKETDWWLF